MRPPGCALHGIQGIKFTWAIMHPVEVRSPSTWWDMQGGSFQSPHGLCADHCLILQVHQIFSFRLPRLAHDGSSRTLVSIFGSDKPYLYAGRRLKSTNTRYGSTRTMFTNRNGNYELLSHGALSLLHLACPTAVWRLTDPSFRSSPLTQWKNGPLEVTIIRHDINSHHAFIINSYLSFNVAISTLITRSTIPYFDIQWFDHCDFPIAHCLWAIVLQCFQNIVS